MSAHGKCTDIDNGTTRIGVRPAPGSLSGEKGLTL
jgi:hypothetical protein